MIRTIEEFFVESEAIGKQLLAGEEGHKIDVSPEILAKIVSNFNDSLKTLDHLKTWVADLENAEPEDDEEAELMSRLLAGQVLGIRAHFRLFEYLDKYEPGFKNGYTAPLKEVMTTMYETIKAKFPSALNLADEIENGNESAGCAHDCKGCHGGCGGD